MTCRQTTAGKNLTPDIRDLRPWPDMRMKLELASRCSARLFSIALAVLGVCGAQVCPAGQEITLEQAVQWALKQNKSLEMARLSCAAGGLGIEEARAEFATVFSPELSASAAEASSSVTAGVSARRKTELGTELTVEGRTTATEFDDFPTTYRDTVSVGIRQPLFRSAGPLVQREAIRLAESALSAARRELELRKADLVVRVVETCEALLRLQAGRELQKSAIVRLDRLLRLTRILERQGRATRVDTLRVEIKLGDSRLNLARTEEQYSSSMAEFADLLGFPMSSEFTVSDSPIPAVSVGEPVEAVGAAWSNRLDLAQVIQDREDARRGVKIARRNLLPDIGLALKYGLTGSGEDSSEAAKLGTDVWFVGLDSQSDLPRRSEQLAVRRAEVESELAGMRIDVFRDAIEKQVRAALGAHARAASGLSMAGKTHELARRNAAFAGRMLERGRVDSFAVSDAEEQLRNAETQWLEARSEACVTAYRLLQVTGALIECPPELKPVQESR